MKNINSLWLKTITWSRRYPIYFGAIAGLAAWVLTQIISGVIQNSTYEYFKQTLLPWMQTVSQIKNYVVVISFLIMFGFGIISGVIIRTVRYKKISHSFSNTTIAEINFLLDNLHGQKSHPYFGMMTEINQHIQKALLEQSEENLNTAIDNYFLTIFKHLGRDIVNGGGIMLPDSENAKWLSFWKMSPDQILSPKKFYIGTDANYLSERGMASHVFIDGKPEIVNILDQHTGKADNPKFRNFGLNPMGHPRIIIPYGSGICMPVRFNNHIVATISIESNKIDTFDEDSKDLLQPIADQLGIILFYYSKIHLI